MADTDETTTTLVDELAALNPARRRELAASLRGVAETPAEVRDGKTASHVVGVLARLLDPPDLYPKTKVVCLGTPG